MCIQSEFHVDAPTDTSNSYHYTCYLLVTAHLATALGQNPYTDGLQAEML